MHFALHAVVLILFGAAAAVAAPAPQSCAQTRESLERIVEAESKAHGFNVDLIAAIIQVESGWNPCARSWKGARGIMQLMGPTARRISGRELNEILDPQDNVHFGLVLLEEIMEEYGDDVDKVLSVFYSGQSNANRPDVRRYVDKVRGAAYERIRKSRKA